MDVLISCLSENLKSINDGINWLIWRDKVNFVLANIAVFIFLLLLSGACYLFYLFITLDD